MQEKDGWKSGTYGIDGDACASFGIDEPRSVDNFGVGHFKVQRLSGNVVSHVCLLPGPVWSMYMIAGRQASWTAGRIGDKPRG